MDCKNARFLLDYARPVPSELDADEEQALEQHLDQCTDCSGLAEAEQHFDDIIGKAMRDVPIPEGLPMRLMTRLSVERDAWYRKLLVRVGAAAVLLIAALSFGMWWLSQPTVLDRAAVDPAGQKYQAEKTYVDGWLKRVGGRHLEAPPEFNYMNLVDFNLTPLQGQQVPFLFFVRDSKFSQGTAEFAKVYILSDRQFNLEELKKSNFDEASVLATHVTIRKHPQDKRLLYLVVYTGDLDDFLEESNQSHRVQ